MHTRFFATAGMLALTLLVGFSACINPREGYAPEQPVKFSHHVHVGKNEIQCTYCHVGVTEGPKATIPGADTCMNCHSLIQGNQGPRQLSEDQQALYKNEISKVREAWKSGEPIKWVKVHDMPDHVQFSHQPHIMAGVGCESCHGNIPKSTMKEGPGVVDRVAIEVPFNMGWCVNCHRQPEYNAPVDCATCHY